MSIPEKLDLPERSIEELRASKGFLTDELAAREVHACLMESPMEVIEKDASIPLPRHSVLEGKLIRSHVHVFMPIPCNSLASFMSTPYDRINEKDYLFGQFGFIASHSDESRILRITRNQLDILFYTGQTILCYSNPAYTHSAFAASALVPEDLIPEIQEHGIFVSANGLASEASLAIPGRILKAHNLHVFGWEHPWMDDVLYPMDLRAENHTNAIEQGRYTAEQLEQILTKDISPVRVLVLQTGTGRL